MSWRPSASHDVIRARAQMLAQIRSFFAEHKVLEVDTPALSRAAVTDPNIESFRTRFTGPGFAAGADMYLQTSPEFPMKRLLCDGIGSIYQICKVFRNGESGRLHNPEFTMLEWYQPGYDYHDLMDEVDALVQSLLHDHMDLESTLSMTYQSAFEQGLDVNPHTADIKTLAQLAKNCNVQVVVDTELVENDKEFWLDLLLTHVIEPSLKKDRCVFLYDYPASQAALAAVEENHDGVRVAKRFELYLQGIELANGYSELSDVAEQKKRFDEDIVLRKKRQQTLVNPDANLLQSLEHGLPACSGVAMGLDRLLMLAVGEESLYKVLSFSYENA